MLLTDNHDPLLMIFMNLFRVNKIFSTTLSSKPANINDRLNESGSLLGTEPLVLLILVTRSHHLDHLKIGVSANILLMITSSSCRLNVLCWSIGKLKSKAS